MYCVIVSHWGARGREPGRLYAVSSFKDIRVKAQFSYVLLVLLSLVDAHFFALFAFFFLLLLPALQSERGPCGARGGGAPFL